MSQECENQKTIKQKRGIWLLTYTSRATNAYRGVAVVRALDARDAERVFLSNSMHNGNAAKIKINKLYQVGDSYESMLLAEEYFKVI